MRLVSPAGTVVECDGGLAEKLKRMGWSGEPDKPVEAKRKPGRPKKSE